MVAWVIGAALITIVFLPVVYFPLDYAWDALETVILGEYTFIGVTAYALTAVELIIDYLMIFSLLIVVNWAIVQSKARSYEP